MSASPEFMEYLRDLLAWLPELRARRMFGGAGLYSGELFFAIVLDDTLYLKGGDANHALYRDGGGERFSYLRMGKPQSLDYWSVPADVLEETDALRMWVRAALDAALRAKRKA